MNQQPNWLELVLHGQQNQGHSTGEVSWKYFCILALVLIYGSKMDQNEICNSDNSVPTGLMMSTACTEVL